MNILVTGGAGYIGSATCFALKKAGHIPIVVDSLVNGHAWAVKYGPLIEADIADETAIRDVCSRYQPQALIHFAAFIDVAESVAHPTRYRTNNFDKAARLFDVVTACGVKQAVFSSTAAVYGTPQTQGPIAEDHPLTPVNPYGESKKLAEEALRAQEANGMRSVILRYFNAAGAPPLEEGIGEAHDPETHLVPNVILAGLGKKDKLHVFGTDYPTQDGSAVRDYIHVMDLTRAHLAALRYLADGGETGVFNLGTGQGSTVLEVIRAVEEALGHPVPHDLNPRRAGDPPFLLADPSRAQKVLGWRPEKTLKDIVSSALSWHKSLAKQDQIG